MSGILVLNGPNLNLLGRREPDQYGHQTLDEIIEELKWQAASRRVELAHAQSNAEHELIELVHEAGENGTEFIILNPAGLTHTSVALRDALLGVAIPFIEVHLSNIHAREPFRRHSYFSDIAVGVIAGLGPSGYKLALDAAMDRITSREFGAPE